MMTGIIISFVCGAAVSWTFAHFYYMNRAKKDKEKGQEADVNVEIQDPGLLPYYVCPRCGSDDLKRSVFHDDKKNADFFTVECKNCGWSEAVKT